MYFYLSFASLIFIQHIPTSSFLILMAVPHFTSTLIACVYGNRLARFTANFIPHCTNLYVHKKTIVSPTSKRIWNGGGRDYREVTADVFWNLLCLPIKCEEHYSLSSCFCIFSPSVRVLSASVVPSSFLMMCFKKLSCLLPTVFIDLLPASGLL